MPAINVLGRDDLSATFERDDGPPVTLYGPAALSFADELAARNAARTAQAAPQAPPPAVLDAPPAPPAMGGGSASGGGGGGAPSQPAMGTDDAALAAQYAPKPAPPPPPAPPAQPVGSGMAFGGPVPQPKAEPWPMVHSPGVSRGQLQQKATQGVWTPGTQSIESEGAVPISPEIEAARATLVQNQLAREVQRHDTEQARLVENESRSWNAAVAMQDEAIAQENVLRKAQERAVAARARVEQIDQTLAEQRANPADFFEKRGGGWAKVAAAIAMGFGQYGATLGGGENGAMKLIFKAIDDEAEAERQNYLRNRDTRGSLLANLNAELGDLDVANEANKALKTRQALAQYERLAIGEKQDDAKLKHAESMDIIRAKYLDHLDAVQKTALGKTVIRTQGQMKYPVAGGSRPMTEDEIIDRQIKKNERQTRLAKSENEKRFQRGESPMGGEHAESGAGQDAASRELWVPGEGWAYSKKEAESLRTKRVAADELQRLTARARDIRRDMADGKIGKKEAIARLGTIKGSALNAIRRNDEMGTLDAGSKAVAEEIFGDPTAFLSWDGAKANDKTREVDASIDANWDSIRKRQLTKTPPRKVSAPEPAAAGEDDDGPVKRGQKGTR